jgi:hypothetical protein
MDDIQETNHGSPEPVVPNRRSNRRRQPPLPSGTAHEEVEAEPVEAGRHLWHSPSSEYLQVARPMTRKRPSPAPEEAQGAMSLQETAEENYHPTKWPKVWQEDDPDRPPMLARFLDTDVSGTTGEADETLEDDFTPGPVGPFLEELLKFITKVSQENSSRSVPSATFFASRVALGRFRLWTRSFDGDEYDLATVIDYSPHLQRTVATLLFSFMAVVVAEFGHCMLDPIQYLRTSPG